MEEINDNLIKLLNGFNEKYSLLKQSLPYHLNVIDELHINENAHSRILCKLLLFRSDTGEYEILQSLIKYISRYNKAFDGIIIKSPEITQELERIDIWVKDKEGGYAIIFENKVYDANDQDAQIARYIQKTRGHKFKDEQIYVVYMPSISDYKPSEQTWVDNETGESLEKMFEERYANVSFEEGVLPWLKDNVLPNIRVKDGYLHTAVLQYIDYLEGLFDKRTNNKKMNMKLQDYLEKELGFENATSDEEKIRNIDSKEAEIQKLLVHISEVKTRVLQQIKERELNLWNRTGVKNKIEEVSKGVCLSDVLKEHNLKYEIYYNEETSDFWIRFYKDGWELSIVFEKKSPNPLFNHLVFIYIGIPSEERVDERFWYGTPKIFAEKNYEKPYHPYGWENVDLYHQKPQKLIDDINNGNFKDYLIRTINSVLNKIEENKICMA